MGHGIAQVFASGGHEVSIIDPNGASLNSAPIRIRENLVQMIDHGVELHDDVDTILARIQLSTDMEEGCAGQASL